VIATHKLQMLNFYPFIQKYLQPSQKDVTKLLSIAVQVRRVCEKVWKAATSKAEPRLQQDWILKCLQDGGAAGNPNPNSSAAPRSNRRLAEAEGVDSSQPATGANPNPDPNTALESWRTGGDWASINSMGLLPLHSGASHLAFSASRCPLEPPTDTPLHVHSAQDKNPTL
jgi:hypothetical protein